MTETVFESDKIQKALKTEKAKDFRKLTVDLAYLCLDWLLEGYPENSCFDIRMDIYTLTVAIDSAFLDLKRAEDFHEFTDGPSPEKKAAALTYWINKFKPVQLICNTARHRELLHLNTDLSVLIGLTFIVSLKCPTRLDNSILLDTFRTRTKEIESFTYTLLWRNPSFRNILPWYEFVFTPCEQ